MKASRTRASVFVAMLFLASAAGAQSYGLNDQVLTIGAAEFRSFPESDGFIDDDGYLYNLGISPFLAAVALPSGAQIERMCLFVNDPDPDADVEVELVALKLVPGGQSASVLVVSPIVSSFSDTGYGYYCTDPFSYTVRSRTDIDGDEIVDAVAYYALAFVPSSGGVFRGLGGLRIDWKRQVSDAPPAPTFGDVALADPAYRDIEALASSGITAGCAGGNFCPDAHLTRRQMAVFLGKALGLHWAD